MTGLSDTIRRGGTRVDTLIVFDGLKEAVLGLEGWASIYDNSLDSMFTNAGEEIPPRC